MAEDEDESAKTGDSKEDKAARMNSAKAFYRAMYAGAEPDPEEFGIDLGAPKQQSGDDGGGSHNNAAVLHLQDQLKETEAKALEWENLYKRIVADFDNFKKRMDRERDEMQAIGMQKGLEAILPGLDDLDMAASKLTETTDPKVVLQSFNMILARFARCLEQVGIKQMQVIGEPFDPRFHEPIQEVHTAEFPEGAVVQQLRPGYLFGEKLLRPTLVNVATAPLEGPGYQPPAPASEAKKVEVSEEEVVAASSPPASSPEVDSQATSDSLPEIKPEAKLESNTDVGSKSSRDSASAAEPSGAETSDRIKQVDSKEQPVEQFATQDIPLKEFKATLEAEAVAASVDQSKEKSSEKVEEAVASAEES